MLPYLYIIAVKTFELTSLKSKSLYKIYYQKRLFYYTNITQVVKRKLLNFNFIKKKLSKTSPLK